MNNRRRREQELAIISCAIVLLLSAVTVWRLPAPVRTSVDKTELAFGMTPIQDPLPLTIRDFTELTGFKMVAETPNGIGLCDWTFERQAVERIIVHGQSRDHLFQIDFYLESDERSTHLEALDLAKSLFSHSDQNQVCDRVAHALFKAAMSGLPDSYPMRVQTNHLEFEFNAPDEEPCLMIRRMQ